MKNRKRKIFALLLSLVVIVCFSIMGASAKDASASDSMTLEQAQEIISVLGTYEDEQASGYEAAAVISGVRSAYPEMVQEALTENGGDFVATAELLIEEANEVILKDATPLYKTFWSLIPPIIAIALALITKEVYISLFVGIFTGALLYSNFNIINTVTGTFSVMTESIGDSWNAGILIFLVVLGIIVALMNRAGGSAAYGNWAASKIKSKRGALLATSALGMLIFVDDYFNCLTVGSVMRPVTDRFNISRAKLAYIIDSTAAPICIIAPISSWAAAVAGLATSGGEEIGGFNLFVQSIPYNFYAILTLVMLVAITVMKLDYGPMKKHEINAEKGDLFTTDARPYEGIADEVVSSKGRVIDLVLPVVILIVSCVAGLIYTGGFFSGKPFIDSFADCDASVGLVLGSFVALIATFLIYIPRRVITFKEFAQCIPDGFRAMVPAILILIFAWTLSGFCSNLGAGPFVANLVASAPAAEAFLPAILFVVALGLAFATGTSWGTFGILIPIVLSVFPSMNVLMVTSISACLAGAVCGDHCSPISDTTIMASSGAQCDHVNHVSTQLPYALTVAAVSFVCYLLAGFVQNIYIMLPLAILLMLGLLFLIKYVSKKRARA